MLEDAIGVEEVEESNQSDTMNEYKVWEKISSRCNRADPSLYMVAERATMITINANRIQPIKYYIQGKLGLVSLEYLYITCT